MKRGFVVVYIHVLVFFFFSFLYHNHLDSMVLRSEPVYFDKTV